MTKLAPLFKWTGGKTKMRKLYGEDFWPDRPVTRFIDAFYGAGSMTHWAHSRYPNIEYVINDQNSELINLYETIRDHTEDFLAEVLKLEAGYLAITYADKEQQKSDRHAYYTKIKYAYIDDYVSMGRVRESAHLFFMMRISFNGWWKVYQYSHGRYSTAPGTLLEKANIIDVNLIRATGRFFREQCTILVGDFENVKPYINSSTYLYLDPPYRDSTTNYTSEGFNDTDQLRVCELFKYADSVGGMVSLSNKEIGDKFFEMALPNAEILLYDVKYTAGHGEALINVKENFLRNFKPTISPIDQLFTFE